jgi:hypothetical protein
MPAAEYRHAPSDRFRQGDIVRDVVVIEGVEIASEELRVAERVLPYCIVMSQDCDLEHDFNNRVNLTSPDHDKYVPTILLAPAYLADTFRIGDHLQAQNLKMGRFNSERWKSLRQNQLYRYHYLSSSQDLQIPELVVDFKHFFTAPREKFYADFISSYLASLHDLFREDFSNRFAYYLSRIGLPEPG